MLGGAEDGKVGGGAACAGRPGDSSARLPSGAGLSQALFLYVLVITIVVTLAPFRFEAANASRVVLSFTEWFELVANVLLFFPLGFLLPLMGHRSLRSPVQVLVAGLALSAGIELVQLFEPARYTSPLDVAANGIGAALGALCQRRISARLRVNARLVGRLSLELPLMGLLYMLLPLMWTSSLAVGEQPLRLLGLAALGFFGARLLGVLQRYHFGPAGALPRWGLGALASGCTLLGIFPAVLEYPWLAACTVLGVAAVAVHEASDRRAPRAERRFEATAIRRAAPGLFVYLVALIAVPVAYDGSAWHAGFGIPSMQILTRIEMVRLLESIAALTFLGYLVAEARGRRELAARASIPLLAAISGATALMIVVGSGFRTDYGASVAQGVLLTAAGLVGGWIYHAQRAHVQLLLAMSAAGHSDQPSPDLGAGDDRTALSVGSTGRGARLAMPASPAVGAVGWLGDL